MSDDPFSELKSHQRESWALFAPLEMVTTMPAARLIQYSGIRPGDRVLDIGCGTGVTAVTAARAGAMVTGIDLTPELIVRARQHATTAAVEVEFMEGDAEALPFEDASFDVVISQFGHMFAPRPEVTVQEMLRVLKPGGTVAFSTWPPDLFTGQMFALVGRYQPMPPGAAPPPQWGDREIVRQRLGSAVEAIEFETDLLLVPVLSPAHYRERVESTVGPVVKLVERYRNDPEKLQPFRSELEELTARYFADNAVRQQYLKTRARKIADRKA